MGANMNKMPYHRMTTYSECIQTLQLACEWMDIKKGRASQYAKLIREFHEEDKRSREHILSFNEAYEITDIYELWESSIDNFQGLKQKIKQVFKKGPILQEDERPDTSTNRPRNDAFVYLLAGKLIKSGLRVISVDGVPKRGHNLHSDADIAFDWQGSIIDIQCKRPQSDRAIAERIREAHKQLNGDGFIGLECSALIRPPGHLIKANSASQAEEILNYRFEKYVKGKVEANLESGILGLFVFARAPAMTRVESSPLFSHRGNHIVHIRRDCISTLWLMEDPSSPNIEILRSIHHLLNQGNQ